MKKSLLSILFFIFSLILQAQKDTVNISGKLSQNDISRPATDVIISIYPIPVRNNSFTIKTDRDISSVKITNIIGQDIFRVRYSNPLPLTKIFLDNPKRGMYIVTVIFSDGTRVVKKIMVEESE